MNATRRLVVGIDYGTSNTAVAYALFKKSSKALPDIEVIGNWSIRDSSDKVPSDVAYDAQGKAVGYGFTIPEDAQTLQWVKLLVELGQFSDSKQRRKPNTERMWKVYDDLEKLGKRPVAVIADYLSWLWTKVKDEIVQAESIKNLFERVEVTVVVTLPACWSDRAKEGMHNAVKQSGIAKDATFLKFASEPEAAAIYGLKSRVKKGEVDEGDCVIVCDAGGGTVDVVSYQIRSLDPLSVDQVVTAQGGFCGSAFINVEFETQLSSFLGSAFAKLSPKQLKLIRDDFEYRIKREYKPGCDKAFSIPILGIQDDCKGRIKNGEILPNDAILEASFESIMSQVLGLVDEQKEGLEAKGLDGRLKGVLLVGGFGGSRFLHERIKQEYPEDEGISVWRGDRSWTAVVQGAVECEALSTSDNATVHSRLSSYNYGVEIRQGSQLKVQWLIRKGQILQGGTKAEPYALRMRDQPWLDIDEYVSLLVSIIRTDHDEVSDELAADTTPYAEVRCRVKTELRRHEKTELVQRDPKVSRIPAELVLALDGPMLSIKCRINGEEGPAVELQYKDDQDRRDSIWSTPSSIAPTDRSGGSFASSSTHSVANQLSPPPSPAHVPASFPGTPAVKPTLPPGAANDTNQNRRSTASSLEQASSSPVEKKKWKRPWGGGLIPQDFVWR
ncbi:hypothetical protein KC338_g1774 [Hortaea werneckii]|uniref:Ig-like domain-containing protein n=1 Tax=Hortaea werneckii TaxID=91943 RepID=A0A3M7G3T5_HORWE|nr:hypothetical protein KC323_g1692 [Hortaea werneckii]KAI6873157.1 hypothetical protein KC338_g1774 [Hortaea werneckii]RMY95818.1 hypothetical protein D0862_08673 [Hortaea werneckii]